MCMSIAHDALLVAERLLERLTQGDADVFDAMVVVDVQVTLALDIEIEGAVACDLFEHVFEEWNPSIKHGFPAAIEIDGDADLSFQGIATDACTSIWHFLSH